MQPEFHKPNWQANLAREAVYYYDLYRQCTEIQ
jgi:hypothetical protein